MGIYEVSVEHEFTATHAVRLTDGSMERPHEHTWKVVATFRSEKLDETRGMVVDFLIAREALWQATADLDGSDLNQCEAFADGGATAERVAEYLAGRLEEGGLLYRLLVTEAPGCSAAFYPCK